MPQFAFEVPLLPSRYACVNGPKSLPKNPATTYESHPAPPWQPECQTPPPNVAHPALMKLPAHGWDVFSQTSEASHTPRTLPFEPAPTDASRIQTPEQPGLWPYPPAYRDTP